MSEKTLTKAIELLGKKQYDKAISILKEYLPSLEKNSASPNGIQQQINTQFLLAECYRRQANQKNDKRLFNQAIEYLQINLSLLKQLADNSEDNIQKQIDAQYLLGQCYFDQAQKEENDQKAKNTFNQAIKHFQISLSLLEKLADNSEDNIQKQIDVQFSLGKCYLDQAKKEEHDQKSKNTFNQAVKHFQISLSLLEQLADNSEDNIKKQIYVQFSLGQCYLDQAQKEENNHEAQNTFKQAIEHFQAHLSLTQQLTDKACQVEEQIYARLFLGGCYYLQAVKENNFEKNKTLLNQATEHLQAHLLLTQKLTKPTLDSTKKQSDAQLLLAICYLEQINKKNNYEENNCLLKKSFNLFYSLVLLNTPNNAYQNGINSIEEQLELIEHCIPNITDEGIKVYFKNLFPTYLGFYIFYTNKTNKQNQPKFTQKQYLNLLKYKKQGIEQYFPKLSNTDEKEKLRNAIIDILAILYVAPYELMHTKLAHYTSPYVCQKLFNLNRNNKENRETSYFRMNSITHMNDPYEGKALLDLINQQELDLANTIHLSKYQTFAACFSARVNDLNQFRLYGKEDNIEASGCCLVIENNYNKILTESNNNTMNHCDIIFSDNSNKNLSTPNIVNRPTNYSNLPKYQIAYIAYLDEYNKNNDFSYKIKDKNGQEFGVYLKDMVNNPEWHKIRKDQLEKSLNELIDCFKESDVSPDDKALLEYIRYLFKDYAFRDEEEVRLLKTQRYDDNSNVCYCPENNQLYIEYGNIEPYVSEIILGTNYEKTNKKRKAEVFRYQLNQRNPNIKVIQSSLPIIPNK